MTPTNNAIVINKNASKIQKFCVLQVALFLLKFVWSYDLASTSSLYGSTISSDVIGESSITLAKYFPF